MPWLPFAFVQRWPFCWWIAVVIDHFSRAVVGHAEFKQQPTAAEVCSALGRAARRTGRAPKCLVSDHGPQFRDEYRASCVRRGVRPRFGALAKTGSTAIIERFVKTLKDEGLRRILVPLRQREMQVEVEAIIGWYNGCRPHIGLEGATPSEVYHRRRPARDGPRFETRTPYPVRRRDKLRGKKGAGVGLVIGHHEGRAHLPVIHLRAAA